MNKQWMALLLSAGIAVTACPVPGAQEPPAEQVHKEQTEESSAATQADESEARETAEEFQSETESSGSETATGASENESSENEKENNETNNETRLDMQTMVSYIQEAAATEEIDLSSDTIINFLLASNVYDDLTEEEKTALSPEITKALETVRNRIAVQISSVNGVTVTDNPWYVQLHVQEDSEQEQTIRVLLYMKLIRVLCRSLSMI